MCTVCRPITIADQLYFDFTALDPQWLHSARVYSSPVKLPSVYLLLHTYHQLRLDSDVAVALKVCDRFACLGQRPTDAEEFVEIFRESCLGRSDALTDGQFFLLAVAADGIERGGALSAAAIGMAVQVIGQISASSLQQLPRDVISLLHTSAVQIVDFAMRAGHAGWLRTVLSLDVLHSQSAARGEKPMLRWTREHRAAWTDTMYVDELDFLVQTHQINRVLRAEVSSDRYKLSTLLGQTCPSARSLLRLLTTVAKSASGIGQSRAVAVFIVGIFAADSVYQPPITDGLQQDLEVLVSGSTRVVPTAE